MNRWHMLWGCWLLVALPLPALAQYKPLPAEIEDELSSILRTQRMSCVTGRPILAVTSAGWCGSCKTMVKSLRQDPRITPFTSQYLILVLDFDSENNQRWRREYPLPPGTLPLLELVHPDGTRMATHHGTLVGGQLTEFLKVGLKRIGRQLTPAELERVTLVEQQSRQTFLSGDSPAAVRQLANLRRIAPLGQLHSSAEVALAADALVAQLTESGRSELEEVERLLAKGQPDAAARGLLKVRREYGLLPEIDRESTSLLDRMRADSTGNVALREAQKSEESAPPRRSSLTAQQTR
ncbi:MAG: hypothetical protein U0935_12015 [Pirellulales bacterium]